MKNPKSDLPKEGIGSPAKARGAAGAASSPSGPAKPKPPSNRASRAAERREAIIAAGLEEFVARGFAATRLDDVARRAGVAKGTIYLHFKDKEALFEELIRTAIVPLVMRLGAPPAVGGSVRDMIESFARAFIQEVATTKRGDIVRLIVAEGPRFPNVADFYYREVVSRGLDRHARLDRARDRARRDCPEKPGALSAAPGGARHRRRDLAEPVQQTRSRWMRTRCFASTSI